MAADPLVGIVIRSFAATTGKSAKEEIAAPSIPS
jgi:hypothetical protein